MNTLSNFIYKAPGLLANDEYDLLFTPKVYVPPIFSFTYWKLHFPRPKVFIDPETRIMHCWKGNKPSEFYTTGIKFLHSNLKHNDMKYDWGTNKDILPFNPSGSCEKGGLYFTNEKNAHIYKNYGPLVATVEIPNGGIIYYEDDKMKTPEFKITDITTKAEYVINLSFDEQIKWFSENPHLLSSVDPHHLTPKKIEMIVNQNLSAYDHIPEQLQTDELAKIKKELKERENARIRMVGFRRGHLNFYGE
jgi:hypothetical protein